MNFIKSDEIRNEFFNMLYDSLESVAYKAKTTAELHLVRSISEYIAESVEIVKED